MEDFPVANRLKSVIEALGLSDSQFADTCSISRPTLSLLLSGKNKKISDVLLSQIHAAFPDVSILWLLFGEGQMFKSQERSDSDAETGHENPFFSTTGHNDDEQLNLVNVKQLENIIQGVVNKSFESSLHSLENLVIKTEEPRNFRKVNKITVYYDDSTFDTFVPEQ